MLRTLAKRCRRFTPLLAAPAALLLSQGEAKAVLTFNIFESAGNVVVQTSGSLDLAGATQSGQNSCGYNGYIQSSSAVICSGLNFTLDAYSITGPASFNGSVSAPADSRSGITATFNGAQGIFTIGPAYVSNTSVVSSATFNGKTLASLGFTTTGLIGTWTLNGTSETIQVVIGAPPSASVPGPLPLLGAGAAFGWARRLRKRTQHL